MDEFWQLYDEQGQPLKGQGRTKDEVFSKGLLHDTVVATLNLYSQ